MEKFREDRTGDVTFLDACALWGITPRSNFKELTVKFAEFDQLLADVSAAIGSDEFVLKYGEVPYSKADFDSLGHLSESLREKFSKEIDTIKQRRTER